MKILKYAIYLALLLLAAPAQAQHETMPIAFFADHVQIGGVETMPRRLELPLQLAVPAGQTVNASTSGTFDYVEVAGTWKFSRTQDTKIFVTHLVVLPGGTLDVGTLADPMPCGRKVEIVIRNVPLDTSKDPYQWGNGLINFGHRNMVASCRRTSFTEAVGSLVAGQQTVQLEFAVLNWKVGDEIVIPDTRQVEGNLRLPDGTTNPNYLNPRRESPVTLASISADGKTIGLSKPLDFEHSNIVDPKGTIVLRPRVANITRDIVISSENPDGSRGHTVDVGHAATYDTRGVAYVGLGRTKLLPNDDTVLPHIGTQEKGRYAVHHHHIGSCPTCVDEDNVAVSVGAEANLSKWAFSWHFTSDTLVQNNIALGFPGAGFVTEDGYEVRNKFIHNFAAYNLGHTKDEQGNFLDDAGNLRRNCPGCNGNGGWWRSVKNYFEKNEAWNNFLAGFDLFNQQQPTGLYPGQVGGDPDTPLNHQKDIPLSFKDNVTAANASNGLEIWGVNRVKYEGLITAHNASRNIFAINSENIFVDLVGMVNVCPPPYAVPEGPGNEGISSSQGYVSEFWMEDSSIRGCGIGIAGGGGANGMHLKNSVLQNAIDLDMFGQAHEQDNVLFEPLGNLPHVWIKMGDGVVWPGPPAPLPKAGLPVYVPDRGSRYKVKSWQQQSGQDFTFFFKQSLATNPAYYSSLAEGVHAYNPPEEGLMNQQTWDKYGMGYGGDIYKQADVVTLDGLINGVARPMSIPTVLPAPKAVVMYPRLGQPGVFESGRLRVYAFNTGDYTKATGTMWIRQDSDAPVPFDKEDGNDNREFTTDHVQPGFHEIEVWRGALGTNARIPGSGMTGRYCIGIYDPVANTCEGQTTSTPPVPPVLAGPLLVGATVVSGTGITGANVSVFANAVPIQAGAVDGDSRFSVVTPPLVLGTIITATQSVGVLTSQPSASITVTTPLPTTTTVPNLVGHTESSATSMLSAAQLIVGAKTGAASATVPTGSVISQAPLPGVVVPLNSAVNLVLSTGPIVTQTLFSVPSGTYTICDSSTPPKCFTLIKQ